ncbi:MAG: SDR family oxidoreductase [Bryobacteraceae bacterium]|jgi:nucleoside-diphosphate-sugar epimerase
MKPPSVVSDVFRIALRVIADLLIVQIAMLAALMVVALQLQSGSEDSVRLGLSELRHYYLTLFLPLSMCFPGFYALSGLYTISRTYSKGLALRRAASSAVVAALGMLAASFLLPQSAGLPRTSALIFAVLVSLGTPGIRWLKHTLFEHEKAGSGVPTPRGDLVLVVGGAGYIGSIVVRTLLKRGFRVRVLDSLVYGASAIEEVFDHPRMEFMRGDCRNIQDVVSAMRGASAVIHLAAIVGDPACDQDHKTAREINYAATRMMIEIAKGEGVQRFVFASSCSVYGASDQVMDENSQSQPISLYADTKVDSEQALLGAATGNFHPTILRFATIFGLSPRPRFDLVVNLLTAKAIKERVITIYNGQQWRPFLHVADAAAAIVRVLEAPVALVGNQIYNVGDSRLNYTLTDVAALLVKFFPHTRVEHIENADRRSYRVSFQKFKGHLGFTCSKSLEDGIKEIKSAFESGQISDYSAALYSNVKFLKQYGSPRQTDLLGSQVMAALAHKA